MAENVAVQRKVVKRGRAGLSRARVLEAAMALADADGLEALSMRRLARELGVETMSLYHYFASKGELEEQMLGAVYAEYEIPSAGGDWRVTMRRSAISAHRALLRHPWAARLIGQPTNPGRAQLEWMDAILGRLKSSGFPAEATDHAYHAIESHIVGYTLWVLPFLSVSDEVAQGFINMVSQSELPHLLAHMDYHLKKERESETSEFEFGLDVLLDGLDRLRG